MLLVLAAALGAHPHITIEEAMEQVDETESRLAELGRVDADHPAFDEWCALQLRLAECRYLLKDPAAAEVICNQVIAIRPDWPDPYSLRRVLRLARGDQAGADADTLRYLDLGAGNAWLTIELLNRPLPPDPAHVPREQALRLALVERALGRWPAEPTLHELHLDLLQALGRPLDDTARTAWIAGPDPVRTAVAGKVGALLGAQALPTVVAWPALPALERADERIDLARALAALGDRDRALVLAEEAITALDKDLAELTPGSPFERSNRLVWRGQRARGLAVAGRWQEALAEIQWLAEHDHDQLTWLEARLHAKLALGHDAEPARRAWQVFYEEVGLEPPAEPEPWP